jgi:putative choline sulfate-utilization transcription factor
MALARDIPPLSWLLAFEAAATHKSFGSAAASLRTSQPAISQRIAQLERNLGAVLFTRTTRGVQLTAAGAGLLAGLSDGLQRLDSAIAEARRSAMEANLTIATDFGFAALWLVPRLSSLQSALAGTVVRVMTSQNGFDLQRDPIDVAVVFGSGGWPGCLAERVMPETVLPVCAPALLAKLPRRITARSLWSLPLLHVDAGADTEWLDWAGYLRAIGAAAAERQQHHLAINNYSLVIQAALAGRGVALGWRPLVDDLLAGRQLVAALERPVTTERGYYRVLRQGRQRTKAVRTFERWLRDELGRST